jgi:putative photosynthetic complex assembly protein
LYAIFAMVLFTIGVVGVYRFMGLEPDAAIPSGIVSGIEMRLVEYESGDVDVYLAGDDTPLARVPEADSGFLRGMIRSLGRQRDIAGADHDAPYRLSRRTDGTLTLDDPLTDESIALRAYGPDNRAQMADLLDKGLARTAPAGDAEEN